MRPILFNKSETKFDSYGLGEIDALKVEVTRERNGLYTLYMEYPAHGPLAATLEKEMKIKADAGTRTKNQTFEITRVVKDSTGILKIYGYHIKHKLEYMAIKNGTPAKGTAAGALAVWAQNLLGDYKFDTWSDITTTGDTTFTTDKMTNAHEALGGVEGSILDIWGGEYEFDNLTVRLHKQLGRVAPTVLEYGRNILSAESDESIEEAYTSVYPFATYTPERQDGDDGQQEPVTVTLPEFYIDSQYLPMYANRRIKVVDFSNDFKDKDIPNADKIRQRASRYMSDNRIGAPKINTKIEYVDLASTLDYQDRKVIEELELCDIVPVYYPQLGITQDDAKATKTVYDVINERNSSVEFGIVGESIRSAMTGGLASRVDNLDSQLKSWESSLPSYLTNASGNKVWYEKPSDNQEHKVGDIYFEKNGIYDRMYVWNGTMWEKRIDTEDVDKVKKELDTKFQESTEAAKQSAAEASKKAAEALEKAGAIIDSQELVSKINGIVLKETNELDTRIHNNRRDIISRTGAVRKELTTYQQSNDAALARITQDLGNTVNKSEIKQTVDGIREEIASIQVGARNLMDGTQDFTGDWFDRQYWTLEKEKYLGLSVYSRQDLWRGMSRPTEVRLGETYTFSAFIKSSVENDLVFMYLDNRLVEPRAALSVVRKDIKVGREWIRVSCTFKTTKAGMMTPRFERNNKNAKLFIAGFKLELGSVPSDWSPSINDTNQTITDRIVTFDRTLDGLRAEVARSKSYVDDDGKRQEQINQLIETKTATAINTLQSEIGKGYVKAIDHTRDLTTLRDDLTLKIGQVGTETDGKIDNKLATYSRTIDGRFTQLSSVYAAKTDLDKVKTDADQTKKDLADTRREIQSVTETTKLYDRLIGSTEDKIKQNIARMTMTDSLFQTEVGKLINKELEVTNYVSDPYTLANYVKKFPLAQDTGSMSVTLLSVTNDDFKKLYFYANKQLGDYDLIHLPIEPMPKPGLGVSFSIVIEGVRDTDKVKVGFTNGRGTSYARLTVDGNKYSGTFFTGWKDSDNQPGLALVIGCPGLNKRGLTISKPIVVAGREPKFEFNVTPRMEINTAVRTVQTQLAGSWAIKNLNSAGDIVSSINLGADGRNRITGKTLHITGETLMDAASIKSAAIANISADKITTGTLNAGNINVIGLNAKSITSGTFTGLTFEGGIIRGNSGNTLINLNTNQTIYNGTAGIEFKSAYNYFKYYSGGTAFMAPTQRLGTTQAAWAFGVNSGNNMDPNNNFMGLKIFNDPGARSVHIIGNDIRLVKGNSQEYVRDLWEELSSINTNFQRIKDWFSRNNLGHPGLITIG